MDAAAGLAADPGSSPLLVPLPGLNGVAPSALEPRKPPGLSLAASLL